MNKKIIENAAIACDNVAKAINGMQLGRPCNSCCPGRDALINTINQLIVEIRDTEPECFQRLMLELQNIKSPYNKCVQPYQFGAINAITNILKNKYIDTKKGKRKIFISHSHSDKTIVDGFVKEILKVGCGFKDSDLFCTLDTSTIRTGDDFREKIIENMRDCDFIFLFISFPFLRRSLRITGLCISTNPVCEKFYFSHLFPPDFKFGKSRFERWNSSSCKLSFTM